MITLTGAEEKVQRHRQELGRAEITVEMVLVKRDKSSSSDRFYVIFETWLCRFPHVLNTTRHWLTFYINLYVNCIA